MTTAVQRRLPIGAEFVAANFVHFRVWAPWSHRVDVVIDNNSTPLNDEGNGYFEGLREETPPGTLYHFQLDGKTKVPDPASRFQPAGPHGPSEIVDPSLFAWTDQKWPGVRLEGQVIYEMHIGTYTEGGTWRAAAQRLGDLAELGITVIEVMPVADFPGNFGWGYDGVSLFAPTRLYGRPDDFKTFVNEAHRRGIGVILDVVYNHLGPDGNYLKDFSPSYFSNEYKNEWGEAINFDGTDSLPVREFFVSNACYWVGEFHLDGLRLDATQQIFDESAEYVVAELTRKARETAHPRPIIMVAENERQHARLVQPLQANGYGLDAMWNDDFHHTARVAATGRAEAYYSDFEGTPQEIISALKWGFLYQGQYSGWQKMRRGSQALDIPAPAFVLFLQNHDQVANSPGGRRLQHLTNPGIYRALTVLLLLAPGTPMLFQGQEFAASAPFFYFADHHPELAEMVNKGRREFLSQFKSLGVAPEIPLPHDARTFSVCKLDHSERQVHDKMLKLHRDLLKLRREDAVFSEQRSDWIHGAVISPSCFALRFLGPDGDHRLILVNLGGDVCRLTIAEPMLVPPAGCRWSLIFCSDSPLYDGANVSSPVDATDCWSVFSNCAYVLKSIPENKHSYKS